MAVGQKHIQALEMDTGICGSKVRDLQETVITPVLRQMFCTDTSILHNTHISNMSPHGVNRRYSDAVYTTSQRGDINHHLPCFQAASD